MSVLFFAALLFFPVWAVAQLVTTNEGEFAVHSTNTPRFNTPIVTGPDGAIYICYVDPNLDTVIRRKPLGEVWSVPTVLEANTQADAFHNQCSIGIDEDGYIHAVYNMHGTPWQYKRSASPNSVAAFTFLGQNAGTIPGKSTPADGNCTGQCETDWLTDEPGIAAIPGNQISYPHFGQDNNNKLYLIFRECLDCAASFFSRQWSTGLVTYNRTTQTWSRVGGVRPWATDPVKLSIGARLFFDATNRMHVSWIWCPHYTSSGSPQPNGGQACFAQSNNVTYAYSDDGGVTMRRADGTAMTLPLGPTESEVAAGPQWFDAVGATGYYAGHTGIMASTTGQPYIVVHPNTGNTPLGIGRGYVTYSGGAWTSTPLLLSFGPSLVYPDALGGGILRAVSGGLRVHSSLNNGASWTITEVDVVSGITYSFAHDPLYLRDTNKLRLYANSTADVLKVYTVQFPESGTNYYVSTIGSDSNNCLTTGAACATIQHAVDLAGCGDVITVLAGTYYQRTLVNKVCTPGTRLTIQGVRGGSGSWDSIVEGTDSTTGWTSAAATCGSALCFRIANPGYVPFALVALPQRLTVWRIHDDQMGGSTCPGCAGTGFSTLSRAANNTIGRSVGTVNFWDGVEALWGEEAGFTYLRFRNGEDPDAMTVRVAPGGATNSGTFTIDGGAYITIQDLHIIGGRYGVDLINGASHITVRRNEMHGGQQAVRAQGGTGSIITDNQLDPRFIGSTAGYAAVPYTPGDWGPQTVERRVRNNIYSVMKFDVGDTTEDHYAPVYIRGNTADLTVSHNTIRHAVVGVSVWESTGTDIHNNVFTGFSAQAIWPTDTTGITYIHENTFEDGEHLIRVQNMDTRPKTLYIYRNLFYQPGEAAKHLHFNHANSGTLTSTSVLWIYHNTFAGAGWALDLGGDLGGAGADDYKIPCVRAINNLISVDGPDGSKGLSSSLSLTGRIGVLAQNWVANVTGVPGSGFSGAGCTASVTGNTASQTPIWTTPPMPDFVPPVGHAAVDSGLRLDQLFTLGGVQYAALPGMTSAYYGDALPDRGALQGAASPPPPEPVLEQVACQCYQVDLVESDTEARRAIPCAVKPGGRIRLVCNVGLTGTDVSTPFAFFASDSGGGAYKVADTLGGRRLAFGPDMHATPVVVTNRLDLGGQVYNPCCGWRKAGDLPQSCTLSAAGAGERTECGATALVDAAATPGQTSTFWLRRNDGTALQTETPITLTIIAPSGSGL